jgi:hypothetical protein
MSAKIKVAFTGCSMTRGDGFDLVYLAPEIWPNIISRVFDFDSRNLGISGASNLKIFQTACQAIRNKTYDMVFCQWTELGLQDASLNDYQNIIELVDYVNVLEDLAQYHQVKIAHINGMIPWQRDLSDMSVADDFSKMTDYTRQILDFDNRRDEQIRQLFLKLHSKFISLNQRLWINLFNSFQSQVVDLSPQGQNPGFRSHVSMSNLVRNYLKKGMP